MTDFKVVLISLVIIASFVLIHPISSNPEAITQNIPSILLNHNANNNTICTKHLIFYLEPSTNEFPFYNSIANIILQSKLSSSAVITQITTAILILNQSALITKQGKDLLQSTRSLCNEIYILANEAEVFNDLGNLIAVHGFGCKQSTSIYLISIGTEFPTELFHRASEFNAKMYGFIFNILNGQLKILEQFIFCTWCLAGWKIPFPPKPQEKIDDLWADYNTQLNSRKIPVLDYYFKQQSMKQCLGRLVTPKTAILERNSPLECDLHHRVIENLSIRYNFTSVYYSALDHKEIMKTNDGVYKDLIEKPTAEEILTFRSEATKFIYCDIQTKFKLTTFNEIWLSPFTTVTWIFIAVAYLMSAIYLWAVAGIKITDLKCNDTWNSLVDKFITQLFQMLAKLLNQDGSFTKHGIKIHVVHLFTSLGAVVLLICYSTIITTNVIAPLNHLVIQNLHELIVVNGYKIQFHSPQSAGWAPHCVWFQDLFKSHGILDKINQSFNVNVSDDFPPTENYELTLLADYNVVPITIGKTTIEAPYYLARLKASYPKRICAIMLEEVDKYPKFWRFKNRFNEKFVKSTAEYFTHGFVQFWDGIDKNRLIVKGHAAINVGSDEEEVEDHKPHKLELSVKILSIFIGYGCLLLLSFVVFIIELLISCSCNCGRSSKVVQLKIIVSNSLGMLESPCESEPKPEKSKFRKRN